MSILTVGGSPRRRSLTVLLALLGVAAVVIGGLLLPAQQASSRPSPPPVVGRTSATCSPAVDPEARAQLAVAANRQPPGREGSVIGSQVGGGRVDARLTRPGTARLLPGPARPVILQADGVMATAAEAMLFSRATTGSLAGLMSAPCVAPNTEHWFVGVGASNDHRTDLVLTNPDEGQAEVDLRFYGRNGAVVVPGSPGLVIEGRSSRTVSLPSLVQVEGPLSVAVRATAGRVSAMALDRRSAGPVPRGADWQPGAVAPASTVVIPALPEGAGQRELQVVNPGNERAEVRVELLGIEGAFAPAGAEHVVLGPESTASLDLAPGLAEQANAVRITSTRPVTAAVHSLSEETGAAPDLAVQSAAAPINRSGLVPLATAQGAEAQFSVSNGGPEPVTVSFEVFNYAGTSLRADDLVVIPGGTATRRLTSPAPSFLVVSAPSGSAVYGSVSYAAEVGGVAGLTAMQVLSSDQSRQAPQASFDPTLGQ